MRFDSELDYNEYDTRECPQCQPWLVKKNGQCEDKANCTNGKVDVDNVCVGTVSSFTHSQNVQRNTQIVKRVTLQQRDAFNVRVGIFSMEMSVRNVLTIVSHAKIHGRVRCVTTTTQSPLRSIMSHGERANVLLHPD